MLVLGAGISGLVAAARLIDAGNQVIVLEARGRVGGRVYTLRDLSPGRLAEAGASSIASYHPRTLELVTGLGLTPHEVDPDASPWPGRVVLRGRVLSRNDQATIAHEMTGALSSLASDAAAINPSAPWTAPNAGALDRWPAAQWVRRFSAGELTKAALIAELTLHAGVEPEAQSTLAWLARLAAAHQSAGQPTAEPDALRYWLERDAFTIEEGMQAIAERLTRRLPIGALRLGWPVERVELTRSGVRVRGSGGRSLSGDAVIVALPPGVLPRIEFDPPLSVHPAAAPGDATVTLALAEGLPCVGRILTDGMAGEIEVARAAEPAVGASSKSIVAARAAGPMSVALRAVLPERRQRLIESAVELACPGFVRAIRAQRFIDWGADPDTRGGRGFPAPGEVTTLAPLLARPIPGPDGSPRMVFAGDFTVPGFAGSIEGAIRGGHRAAEHFGAMPAETTETRPAS